MREEEEAEEEATRKKLAETHRRVSVSFPQLRTFSLLPYVLKYFNNPIYSLTLTNIIAKLGGEKGGERGKGILEFVSKLFFLTANACSFVHFSTVALMKLHSGFMSSTNMGSAVLCKFTSDMLSVGSWKSFLFWNVVPAFIRKSELCTCSSSNA